MTPEELKGWRAAYEVMIANDPDSQHSPWLCNRSYKMYASEARSRLDGERLVVLFPMVYIGVANKFSAEETDRLKAWIAKVYYDGDDRGRSQGVAGDIQIASE